MRIERAGQEQPEEMPRVPVDTRPPERLYEKPPSSQTTGRRRLTPKDLLLLLSPSGESFTAEEFASLADREGIPRPREMLKKLLSAGEIYEPEVGRYARVP